MAPRVTNLALQYITTGISLSSSWKVMKPHMQSMLANVVFSLCCFDDEDEELWEEDPQEYIRKVDTASLASSAYHEFQCPIKSHLMLMTRMRSGGKNTLGITLRSRPTHPYGCSLPEVQLRSLHPNGSRIGIFSCDSTRQITYTLGFCSGVAPG